MEDGCLVISPQQKQEMHALVDHLRSDPNIARILAEFTAVNNSMCIREGGKRSRSKSGRSRSRSFKGGATLEEMLASLFPREKIEEEAAAAGQTVVMSPAMIAKKQEDRIINYIMGTLLLLLIFGLTMLATSEAAAAVLWPAVKFSLSGKCGSWASTTLVYIGISPVCKETNTYIKFITEAAFGNYGAINQLITLLITGSTSGTVVYYGLYFVACSIYTGIIAKRGAMSRATSLEQVRNTPNFNSAMISSPEGIAKQNQAMRQAQTAYDGGNISPEEFNDIKAVYAAGGGGGGRPTPKVTKVVDSLLTRLNSGLSSPRFGGPDEPDYEPDYDVDEANPFSMRGPAAYSEDLNGGRKRRRTRGRKSKRGGKKRRSTRRRRTRRH
uniref:Uncharacterized protein n=1 Tax=viral metagenome TaxID=1070528 RepID=A0A6C0B8R7_9ZZZZ